jgi:hypothetical protein
VNRRDIFEQLLLCWQETERQLAGELRGDRDLESKLAEEMQDWREQWARADPEPES